MRCDKIPPSCIVYELFAQEGDGVRFRHLGKSWQSTWSLKSLMSAPVGSSLKLLAHSITRFGTGSHVIAYEVLGDHVMAEMVLYDAQIPWSICHRTPDALRFFITFTSSIPRAELVKMRRKLQDRLTEFGKNLDVQFRVIPGKEYVELPYDDSELTEPSGSSVRFKEQTSAELSIMFRFIDPVPCHC